VQSPPLDEIEDLVRKIVEAEGLELVDLEFKTGKSRDLLRIFIDKTGGVTLDDCERVSRQVGAVLDVKDLLRQAYVLEVSSPGIDRPFKTERDFQRSLGRTIKVYFGEGESPAVGKLLEVQPDQIVMEDNGKLRKITLDRIKKAHQEIEFGHPKKNPNQRRRK
jgi:ribosome maturation factor RimP